MVALSKVIESITEESSTNTRTFYILLAKIKHIIGTSDKVDIHIWRNSDNKNKWETSNKAQRKNTIIQYITHELSNY